MFRQHILLESLSYFYITSNLEDFWKMEGLLELYIVYDLILFSFNFLSLINVVESKY